jgi:hypothetical protein
MSRTMLGWMTVGLVTLFSGCAMCAHPFDYCGPTVTGQCGDECAPNAPRAGSILSGSVSPTLAYSEVEFSSAGSNEDRLLEELMEAAPRELEDSPTIATPEGWTARTNTRSDQR